VDPEDVIGFANPAAIAALGYDSAGELFGRRSHETIHHRHPDGTPLLAADCAMLVPRATGETVASDLDWFFRRDGSMFPVSYVSVPIEMPDGRGAVVAFADIEDRLRAEHVLREHDAVLEAQQAALRRVATLVAGGAASAEVFAAIANEVGHVIGLPLVAVWRYEPDGTATVIGAWGEHPHPFQAGTRWPLDGPTICARVLKTGRTARIDDFAELPGTIADAARKTGIRACAGAPIIVDGDVWGATSADSTDRVPLPDHIEDRLAEFTELVATAISNTASRAELARLADEQAALRRVATLVARGVPPPDVFAAVAREVGLLLGVDWTHMARYELDGTATGVAGWSPAGGQILVGTRVDLEGESVAGLVSRTGRPARMHGYENASGPSAALARELGLRSSVGGPIVVDQRLWGVMIASSKGGLPVDAESRIAAFTELVATAISNVEARAEVQRLADEQAALRRVATLVAQGVPSSELFGAVTEEVGTLLRADLAGMIRYEPDATATVVASWGELDNAISVATNWSLEGDSVSATVHRTERPARIDDCANATGSLGTHIRDLGIRSAVATPIVVGRRLWGAMIAASRQAEPLPATTESRIGEFTALVATAISNIHARSDLAASRARIVAATDAERRRVVRDLHDGAQQRLVHTVITLKLARRALQNEEDAAPALVTEALDQAERATDELRELAHGILPTVLTRGGLRTGVDALASRMPVPVDNAVAVGRLPAAVEATAYYVVAEALTNVAKHARAGHAEVTARVEDGTLRVQVRDDGAGGARSDGSGLLGLADRLAVLDGQLRVESPVDGGTLVAADIPSPTSSRNHALWLPLPQRVAWRSARSPSAEPAPLGAPDRSHGVAHAVVGGPLGGAHGGVAGPWVGHPAVRAGQPLEHAEQAERVVDRAVAALRADDHPAAGDLAGQERDALRERAEAGRGDQHPAGRVKRRGVLTGRDEDEVGGEGAHDRGDELVEGEQVAGVRGRRRERHVDRAALRARAAGRAQVAGVGGVPVALVQREGQDVGAVPEDALGAVSDVHVPVDDRDPVRAAGASVLSADREVVEVRRRDGAVGLGVVAGRARVHERALQAAVEHRVDRGEHAAGGQPRGVPGGGCDGRVLAVPRPARARLAQAVEVCGRVDREQRVLRGGSQGQHDERAAQGAARDELVRLGGEHRVRDVRGAQRERPPGDVDRRGRRVVGKEAGRVGVSEHVTRRVDGAAQRVRSAGRRRHDATEGDPLRGSVAGGFRL
jgi:PAS domain S-box-containing protein